MSQQKNFVHPFTFTVTAFGLEYPTSRLRENDIRSWIFGLADFTLMLDPEIKQTLKKEIAYLESVRYGEVGIDRTTELECRKIAGEIYNALHEAGYFLAAKMTPPTRKGGLDMLQERMNKSIEKTGKPEKSGGKKTAKAKP
jgi:hypothetical protein